MTGRALLPATKVGWATLVVSSGLLSVAWHVLAGLSVLGFSRGVSVLLTAVAQPIPEICGGICEGPSFFLLQWVWIALVELAALAIWRLVAARRGERA